MLKCFYGYKTQYILTTIVSGPTQRKNLYEYFIILMLKTPLFFILLF